MANSTTNTKQSPFLTLGEKIQIFEHRNSNPKDSFETIAKVFSDKLNKKLQRAAVYRAYNRIREIKSEKSNGLQINDSQKCINRFSNRFSWNLRSPICIWMTGIMKNVTREMVMTRETLMKDLTKKTKMKTVSFSNWFNPRR